MNLTEDYKRRLRQLSGINEELGVAGTPQTQSTQSAIQQVAPQQNNKSQFPYKVGQTVRVTERNNNSYFKIDEITPKGTYKISGAWAGGENVKFEVDGTKLYY